MITRLFLICLVIFSFACNSDVSREDESSDYFKKEIDGRITKITKLKLADSLKLDAVQMDKKFDRVLLLTKDIENLDASIHESTELLDDLSAKFNIKRSDFTDITKEMTLEEMANAIKGNELNFFNQVLFKYGGAANTMYSAQ